MNKERNIKIEILSIEVETFYYSIKYKLTIDGKVVKDTYESDYEGWFKGEFKKHLEDGGALDTIQEQLSEIGI